MVAVSLTKFCFKTKYEPLTQYSYTKQTDNIAVLELSPHHPSPESSYLSPSQVRVTGVRVLVFVQVLSV